ncbi:MAG: hypothetical protein RR965_02735, partial [Enterococcus sp.]
LRRSVQKKLPWLKAISLEVTERQSGDERVKSRSVTQALIAREKRVCSFLKIGGTTKFSSLFI